MSKQEILIEEDTRSFARLGVSIHMSRADAVALFHAINRTLAVLDDARANADDGLVEDMDPGDQAAYDMANEFIAQLQTALQIDPDPEGLIAQQH